MAAATGAKVQSTVNKLDTKVLGSCGTFQEKQVCICVRRSDNFMKPPRVSRSCQEKGAAFLSSARIRSFNTAKVQSTMNML